ncbi:MAG: spore coat associated protein CotJA [Tepidanaerobacteraceae bacterium]
MASNDKNTTYSYMEMRLAEAYIPMQVYGETFNLNTALRYGTLFPDLYRPYAQRPLI